MRSALGVCALLSACTTGRGSMVVPLRVAEHAATSTLALGEVRLTEARLGLESARFREPGPAVTLLEAVVPRAWAHPGHGPDTEVAGEWLGPASVDLLAGADLGGATVYEGAIAEAELTLGGTVSVALEGEVTGAEGTVAFGFVVAVPEPVAGIAFDTELDAEGPAPTWSLSLDVARVLGSLEQAGWPASGGTTLDDDETLKNTFLFELVRGTSWQWEAE